MKFWVGLAGARCVGEEDLASLVPERVVMRLKARRTKSPAAVPEAPVDPPATCAAKCVPLTALPEDVARHLFTNGWFETKDLLRLRVSRSLRAVVGARPLLMFKHALPILRSWRTVVRPPLTPRRSRQNSFLRSPARRTRDRAVVLF